jgi:hypothetical protein
MNPVCKAPQDVFRFRRELAKGKSRIEGELIVQGKSFENRMIAIFA